MSVPRDVAKKVVGPGWSPLVDLVYDRLPDTSEVLTVKEKYGELRIYVDQAPSDFLEFLTAVEDLSRHMCDLCGDAGRQRGESWIRTLCDSCWEA